ncbi:MAG: divalent-cation tolerance protein CutA [Candidatus Portnoybacteria bacterium]|nr:divalent-cation tolerance protein CutA [Candidatus Portnoybacteria bacterium]
MIFIYTTFPTKKEARAIAKELVIEKLAACVNIFPIHSLYKWDGKLEDSREYGTIIKTKRQHFESVKQYIASHHSYQIPCIVEIPLGRVLKPYEEWVNSNSSGKATG